MNLYKMIPKVDQLLENDVINKLLKSNSKNLVMESIHEELDNIRNKISSGYDENSITNYIKNLVNSIEKNVYNKNILNLRKVINASGVVILRITAVGFGNGKGGNGVSITNAVMQATYIL